MSNFLPNKCQITIPTSLSFFYFTANMLYLFFYGPKWVCGSNLSRSNVFTVFNTSRVKKQPFWELLKKILLFKLKFPTQ